MGHEVSRKGRGKKLEIIVSGKNMWKMWRKFFLIHPRRLIEKYEKGGIFLNYVIWVSIDQFRCCGFCWWCIEKAFLLVWGFLLGIFVSPECVVVCGLYFCLFSLILIEICSKLATKNQRFQCNFCSQGRSLSLSRLGPLEQRLLRWEKARWVLLFLNSVQSNKNIKSWKNYQLFHSENCALNMFAFHKAYQMLYNCIQNSPLFR